MSIFEQDLVLTRYASGGMEHRIVEPGQLRALFGELQSVSGWIPVGLAVDRLALSGDGSARVIVRLPARQRTVRVAVAGKIKEYKLRCPAMLGELEGKSDGGHFRWDKVLKAFTLMLEHDKPLAAGTTLLCCPFPNCYDNGGLCMGSVDMARMAVLGAGEVFERAFFQSEFSDHSLSAVLVDGAAAKGVKNVMDFLRRGRVDMKLVRTVGTFGDIFGQAQSAAGGNHG